VKGSEIRVLVLPMEMIERHGAEATLEAARMIDAMLDRGDLAGRGVWRRIRQAIVELQARPEGPAHEAGARRHRGRWSVVQ
jgi:hypothetical protein